MKHLMDCISGSQRDAWFQLRNRNKRQLVYSWRRRVEVESTIRPAKGRIAGFEGREGHRTPFASVAARSSDYRPYSTYSTCGSSATRHVARERFPASAWRPLRNLVIQLTIHQDYSGRTSVLRASV